MTLIEYMFQTHPHKRNVPFADIAKYCDLELDEVFFFGGVFCSSSVVLSVCECANIFYFYKKVELVVMRAFSLKLLSGEMDEISKTVNVTYVTPRSLELVQIKRMRIRMDEWLIKVKDIEKDVKNSNSGFVFDILQRSEQQDDMPAQSHDFI
ncbi:hypothetical protein RFI_27591 [Reticulomyxa filosa]|uniref:PCI domain-containing protein n=1 Tax=Reticulomyxa filosa TaxID=46433 RepID=X6M8I8_RETFI|nr:hypothetical protein RFI_27591 [Reticulomyxa filosa]|eukprot:ETO09787.1 hypothetical protein RFI_27591 [Reticulomyxa filosa]